MPVKLFFARHLWLINKATVLRLEQLHKFSNILMELPGFK